MIKLDKRHVLNIIPYMEQINGRPSYHWHLYIQSKACGRINIGHGESNTVKQAQAQARKIIKQYI